MTKPSTADGYASQLAPMARAMCLYVATILGDLLDHIVVVGGLVPYLIIDQERGDIEPHVGTRDLDLGLTLSILDDALYKQISERLRDRGFELAENETGNPTRQTWRLPDRKITIDFLIPQSPDGPGPGKLQDLEEDFAAIVTPALACAFEDVVEVRIDGTTPRGERAERTVRVCGPAAFIVMKAHAFHLRGENKDAYDLVYVLKNHDDGTVRDIARRFDDLPATDHTQSAIEILERDFATVEHVGPRRAADFMTARPTAQVRAEAMALVATFLDLIATTEE